MPKKAKETEVEEVEETATEEKEVKSEAKKGKFKVFDSNGKQVREVETEEEAKALAKIYGGKVK